MPPKPVNVRNFVRAETDLYFGRMAASGAFGKLVHAREPADIKAQTVVRMNRDTLYSSGVFDLEAGPVTVVLPDAGPRFMSMQVISNDHYTIEVVYGPGRRTYTRDLVGARYAFVIIRTLADPEDANDLAAAHAAQDAIRVEQAAAGSFAAPDWDEVSQAKVRDALSALGALGGVTDMFGTKAQVKPVDHLIGTAIGWGGNPKSAAIYESVAPEHNDGKTTHRLTVHDVPVDGFWSLSVYNAKGFFEPTGAGGYSLNNLTAHPNPDGSFTIQFGGCGPDVRNCLGIMPGWNYTVRLYRPQKPILDGLWSFPVAEPVA